MRERRWLGRPASSVSGRAVTTATDPIEARRTERAQDQLEAAKVRKVEHHPALPYAEIAEFLARSAAP